MKISDFLHDSAMCLVLPCNTEIKERVEKNSSEVDLLVQHENDIKKLKVMRSKEKKVLKFLESYSLICDSCTAFVCPFEVFQISEDSELMIISREYYLLDLEEMIENKSFSVNEIIDVISSICDILMILSENDIVVKNLKSSNIVYDNQNNLKLCDLFLNELRKEGNVRVYDICFKSPEELSGYECNDRSVIWSIGCTLYEMMFKKLPFNEDDNITKTKENIVRCKYNIDVECDEMMKKMIDGMLKVKHEDRISLKVLRKEMMKINEMLIDSDGNLMIYKERKEVLFNSDCLIVTFPIIGLSEYYLKNDKWEECRDRFIESYNNEYNERIIVELLKIHLCKEWFIEYKSHIPQCLMSYYKTYNTVGTMKIERIIQNKLKFHIQHQCKIRKNCYLDEMMLYIDKRDYDKESTIINTDCFCMCEEGIKYLFRVLKQINLIILHFNMLDNHDDLFFIPLQNQSLFASLLSQLSNLQRIYIRYSNLTYHFVESFVKAIPFMINLKYVDLQGNPISPKGFTLLFPYLYLLINWNNELNLIKLNLNDESMILLSEELYKYPKLDFIDITENENIHSNGLKALFSKFPISKIDFDFNGSKELMIDKNIPKLFKDSSYLNLSNSEIDDNIFIQFILLRSNELREIEKLYLSNNKLTFRSIECLINNLSLFPKLRKLHVNGNEIGDEGMKILSPHLHLLVDKHNMKLINCLKMGLSSVGLKYLVDGLKNEKINILNISDNKIDSDGIEYLMKYVKKNDNIMLIFIHNNPIGNAGFKILLNDLEILSYQNDFTISIKLRNISIDDESVMLLTDNLDSIKYCSLIDLNGNNVSFNVLKLICSKSLKNEEYPLIKMNNPSWSNEELGYYLEYCIKKGKKSYDFSNMNINDSHISIIKHISRCELDLSNNQISSKGLKELPKDLLHISIFNNPIEDEGIEIICKYLRMLTSYRDELNLSNIGMSEKGLKMLIERLKAYDLLKIINLSGNEMNERELRLMKENEELFVYIEELSITVKENIDKSELKSFLETFSSIEIIHLDGISEEEKKELSKVFEYKIIK